MNDKQKEVAARKLCELRGRDPDELVGHGAQPDKNGVVYAVLLQSPAWKLVLNEIEDALNMEEALKAGREV